MIGRLWWWACGGWQVVVGRWLCACSVCLQCVLAVCACSVCLQCVLAVCACSVCLQCVLAVYACSVCLQCVLAVCACSVCLQCVLAVYACSVCLQCVLAVCACSVRFLCLCTCCSGGSLWSAVRWGSGSLCAPSQPGEGHCLECIPANQEAEWTQFQGKVGSLQRLPVPNWELNAAWLHGTGSTQGVIKHKPNTCRQTDRLCLENARHAPLALQVPRAPALHDQPLQQL